MELAAGRMRRSNALAASEKGERKMRYFFNIGNQYIKESDWKILALVKFCLFSMGVIVGVLLPAGGKTIALWVAGCVFLVTYIPLMAKLLRIMKRGKEKK